MTTFARPSLRIEQQTVRLQFEQRVQNRIKYAPVKSNHKDSYKVDKNGNLILTGWGYAEYVASAAVALKALGGREELRCDVRLITATNRDLPKMVCEGKFREDLYQRLNVVQMRTPSLREHKDDIALIANSWWRKFHDNAVLSEGQLSALMDYDYPGNVRELIKIVWGHALARFEIICKYF